MKKQPIEHQSATLKKKNDGKKHRTGNDLVLNSGEETIQTGTSSLDHQLKQLQQENELLKQENKTLEIDNICLEQKNWELTTRIDDLATHYPKASVLLGKNPEQHRKQNWIQKIKQKIK